MRKLIFAVTAAVALLVALPSKPAEASSCVRHCSPLLDAMGWTLAAGLAGGYAYGTGYFIYHDATDATQTVEYGGAELGVNGALGLLLALGAVDAGRDGRVGSAVGFGAFSALHLTLAVHGGWRVYDRRGDIRPSSDVVQRFAYLGYGTNTLLWALQVPGQHGRGYGIAEAAVNAPIAAGLGYLAVERGRDGKIGPALLFGGMAVVSGALAIHGVYTAVAPWRPRVEVFGADFAPTVVSDGREVAPGLGAAGTW